MNTDTPFASLIPPNLQTPEFISVWSEWVAERKQRRRAMTERAAVLQLKKCSTWGPENSVAAIYRSIESGWTGLFERKPDPRQVEPKSLLQREVESQSLQIQRMFL